MKANMEELVDVTQVLRSERGGAEGPTFSLFHVVSDVDLLTFHARSRNELDSVSIAFEINGIRRRVKDIPI